MMVKYSTLAAASALLVLVSAVPAAAFTHHPATPEEIRQTDALNAQALENARGATAGQMAATQTTAAVGASASMTAAGSPLSSLTAMPSAIGTATVQCNSGAVVGSVQKILTGTDGKPSMVNVALTSNKKIVAISANELNYDAAHNILVASLTAEQIMSLPATGS
jgi:hypothetical protein